MAEAEGQQEEGDWDGDYEEDEEDEEDLAAEAAEVARRLEAQLWADIKANGGPEPESTPAAPGPPIERPPNPKEIAAVQTVRAILASLEHDSLAHSTLAASKIPEFAGDSLLDILNNMAASGTIPPGVALPISRFLVSLAKSDVLFAALRHSSAPAQTLKRKREEADEGERARKRVFIGNHPLYVEVAEAVRVVEQTLSPLQTPLGPTLIASIEPQLHRVFLFAVSAATAPGNPHATPLQEISGLVQVLGVLSGIQIGGAQPNTTANAETDATAAVHPCLVAGCGKVFARPSNLLAHQPSHDSPPSKSAKAEEGELDVDVLTAVQTVVLILHPLLQTHVARALSASSAVNGSGASGGAGTNGQATLASVIAAAQAQAQGAAVVSPPPPVAAVAAPTTAAQAQLDAEGDVDADGEADGEDDGEAGGQA
ncbi:hypothetical protein C8F04DRAFT_61608 [Mycena alexandri]|uniref:C2H2-type domain-containing protein n=1 Tax=Mycena alexandri TaxID=1745969 RepID=A0AAD6SLN3_9AGAR|nr:hypothetical protein C8F04DRAFT_61608 [Mycena alexandri]